MLLDFIMIFPYFTNKMEGTVSQYEIRGVKREVIITPKVLEVAKKYFNCTNIKGVELEDQDLPGLIGIKEYYMENI